MMKALLLVSSLVFFISCTVEEAPTPKSNLGSVREFLQVPVNGEEFAHLCSKLEQKESRLPSLSTAQAEYNFSYSQKNCNQPELGPASEVAVTIDQLGGNYFFRPVGNVSFGFKEIETSTEGIMKEICANVRALTNPLMTGSNSAIWFRKINQDNCRSDKNNICIKFEKGSVDNYNRYAIHTEEIIQFSLNGNNTGFFVKRYLSTLGNCSTGSSIQREAVMQ